jgi:hypothetical protein
LRLDCFSAQRNLIQFISFGTQRMRTKKKNITAWISFKSSSTVALRKPRLNQKGSYNHWPQIKSTVDWLFRSGSARLW